METVTINIPASSQVDLADIQRKLSLYAEFLVESLKRRKTQTTHSEPLSSIYGIAKIEEETTLEKLKEEAFAEKFKL